MGLSTGEKVSMKEQCLNYSSRKLQTMLIERFDLFLRCRATIVIIFIGFRIK
jgi:hypothetical protein